MRQVDKSKFRRGKVLSLCNSPGAQTSCEAGSYAADLNTRQGCCQEGQARHSSPASGLGSGWRASGATQQLHGHGTAQLCCLGRPLRSSPQVPSGEPPRLHRGGPARAGSATRHLAHSIGPDTLPSEESSIRLRTRGHCTRLWRTPGLSPHPPHR